MKRYMRLYRVYLNNSFKILRMSTANFVIGFIAFLAIQISSLLFLQVTFGRIPSVNGYSFYQVLFIYGFSQIPRGLDHLYSDYLWIFSMRSVVKGEMDRYLVRPVSPYFQVICERVQFDALGEIVVGVVITLYAITGITFPNPGISLFLGFIYLITGCMIYTSIKTICASLAFWLKKSIYILQSIYGLSDLTKYPMSIYPPVVRSFLTYIIPFGVVAFLPSELIFTSTLISPISLTIIGMACLFTLLASIIWKKGVKSYESAGN
ncbi:ABC-2 family transporter protein [Vagococcus sp. DIV0080]|uniref:ABC-2 family transporter protein n=1 Tax=Candidatus Vagococcus giribetii TaxID=2230876 RepID=A0ABS3HT04_9ENTE|nr:ABC-2 family transporter protein [Vagococcus sp. DIV0080]MBO0476888.1 ABC-2 family transporter protein [Vagococcus sp. DIV0080]